MTDKDIKHLIAALVVALEKLASTPTATASTPTATASTPTATTTVTDPDRVKLDNWIATLSGNRSVKHGKLLRSEQQKALSRYALILRGIKAGWTLEDCKDSLSLSKAHILFCLDTRTRPELCPWRVPGEYIERARALKK